MSGSENSTVPKQRNRNSLVLQVFKETALDVDDVNCEKERKTQNGGDGKIERSKPRI